VVRALIAAWAKCYILSQSLVPKPVEGNLNSGRSVSFGVFEMDLRAGELRKQGLKIKLQEQPFQVLAMLLEHPGELVSREELQRKLWPADTFVDFDHGLNKAITKIREALGDSAESPRFVETLPRRGYRFIAPVNEPDEPAVPVGEPPATRSRGLARALFLLVQVSYLVMYALAFHYLPAVGRLSVLMHFSGLPAFVALCALCGAALRLYLLSAAALDYPHTGRLFRRLFPAILLVDLAWSASPLLLFHKLGELVLLCAAGLAFLPFSQRSLVLSAYAPSGGPRSSS